MKDFKIPKGSKITREQLKTNLKDMFLKAEKALKDFKKTAKTAKKSILNKITKAASGIRVNTASAASGIVGNSYGFKKIDFPKQWKKCAKGCFSCEQEGNQNCKACIGGYYLKEVKPGMMRCVPPTRSVGYSTIAVIGTLLAALGGIYTFKKKK